VAGLSSAIYAKIDAKPRILRGPVTFFQRKTSGANLTGVANANFPICKLSLFGSALGDDFGSDSDIDFLVEFETGKVPGLIGLSRMERELSEILGGRKVHPRTPQDLSKYFREDVLASAEVQYAASINPCLFRC
jgi:predicted nucleotidyltransferase